MAELGTSQGYKGVLEFAKASAWDDLPTTAEYRAPIIEESFVQDIQANFIPGATGNRGLLGALRRLGTEGGSGGFKTPVFSEKATELAHMALGAAPPNLATGETQLYVVQIQKAGPDIMNLLNARVKSATFASSQSDQTLTAAFELIGSQLAAGAAAFATPSAAPDKKAFQHYEAVLTLGGGTVEPVSVELTIENAMAEDVFRTSRQRLAIPSNARTVKASVELDWNTANKALYDAFIADTATTFSLVYTIGLTSITFASATGGAHYDGSTPTFSAGDDAITFTMPISFTGTGADELTIVVDDNPA